MLCRSGVFVLLAATAALLSGVWGCGDDENPVGPRKGRTISIPSEMEFTEAAAQALPGDTLDVQFSPFPLSETVVFKSGQTPLVIQGNKQFPVLSALHSGAVLRFDSPHAGTKIVDMGFSGGNPAVQVNGGNELLVDNCRFSEGAIQIRGAGSGLSIQVSNTVMDRADFFSLDMGSGVSLISTGNTIDQAGDCGIILRTGSSGTVVGNVIWRSVNYGIACSNGTLAEGSGCNDIHLSGTSSYLGCTAPADDIHMDPLFCAPDATSPDYRIRSDSPCAPLNSGSCGLIGALPVGCDPAP